jgi:hypothetical protein
MILSDHPHIPVPSKDQAYRGEIDRGRALNLCISPQKEAAKPKLPAVTGEAAPPGAGHALTL